jgi:hypothetical protein
MALLGLTADLYQQKNAKWQKVGRKDYRAIRVAVERGSGRRPTVAKTRRNDRPTEVRLARETKITGNSDKRRTSYNKWNHLSNWRIDSR